jgi:hypothetical protein
MQKRCDHLNCHQANRRRAGHSLFGCASSGPLGASMIPNINEMIPIFFVPQSLKFYFKMNTLQPLMGAAAVSLARIYLAQ